MGEMIELIVTVGGALLLTAVGFFVGRSVEKKHYASIHEREAKFSKIPTIDTKLVPDPDRVEEARLVYGSAVISVDYYKMLLAGLRAFFGGEVKSFSPLLDRARREATLRMKEAFPDADLFVNVRFETTSISQGDRNASVHCVDAMVYATGIRYRR